MTLRPNTVRPSLVSPSAHGFLFLILVSLTILFSSLTLAQDTAEPLEGVLYCPETPEAPKDGKAALSVDTITFKKGQQIVIPITRDFSVGADILGTVFDENFEEIEGFNLAKNPNNVLHTHKAPVFNYDEVVVSKEDIQSKAMAKFFPSALFNASVGRSQNVKKAYAYYRAAEYRKSIEIKKSSYSKVAPCAAFVASAVYDGWSALKIIDTKSEEQSTDVLFSLTNLAGIELKDAMKKYNLTSRTDLVNLQLREGKTPEFFDLRDVVDHYKPIQEALPAFVEFTATRDIIIYRTSDTHTGEYVLSSLEVDISRKKSNGTDWDGFDNTPEVSIDVYINGKYLAACSWSGSGKNRCKIDKKFTMDGSTKISIRVIDRDAMANDDIGTAESGDVSKSETISNIELSPTSGKGQLLRAFISVQRAQ